MDASYVGLFLVPVLLVGCASKPAAERLGPVAEDCVRPAAEERRPLMRFNTRSGDRAVLVVRQEKPCASAS